MRRLLIAISVLVAVATAGAEERRKRILLSNDDGITAPGLLAVYTELTKLGEVTVAAPAENQSGVGHGVTFGQPIMVKETDPLTPPAPGVGPQGRWYRIAARPATCVRLALAALLSEKPDLVVSGINRGDNSGLTIYVSGTLGAAREAAFDGLHAIAASLVMSPQMDYKPGAVAVGRVAAAVLAHGLPAGTLLNVNIPTEIRGFKIVPHSMSAGVTTYQRRVSPRGELYFWDDWKEPEDSDPETDVAAMRAGYVAVTPLRVDVNDAAARKVIEGLELR